MLISRKGVMPPVSRPRIRQEGLSHDLLELPDPDLVSDRPDVFLAPMSDPRSFIAIAPESLHGISEVVWRPRVDD